MGNDMWGFQCTIISKSVFSVHIFVPISKAHLYIFKDIDTENRTENIYITFNLFIFIHDIIFPYSFYAYAKNSNKLLYFAKYLFNGVNTMEMHPVAILKISRHYLFCMIDLDWRFVPAQVHDLRARP